MLGMLSNNKAIFDRGPTEPNLRGSISENKAPEETAVVETPEIEPGMATEIAPEEPQQ